MEAVADLGHDEIISPARAAHADAQDAPLAAVWATRRCIRGLLCLLTVPLLTYLGLTAFDPAFGVSGGHLTIVRLTPTPAGGRLLVVVPPALTGVTEPTRNWAGSASGSPLRLTTSRLADGHLQVLVVLQPSTSRLAAEQGAAAEFLHQLPSSTPVGIVDGSRILGTNPETALPALGDLEAGGNLSTSVETAVHAGDTSADVVRHAIVVFAPCASLPPTIDGFSATDSSRELDVVGFGFGCSSLGALTATHDGVLVIGHGSGDELTASADQVADRLLGEYDVVITGKVDGPLTLTARAAGIVASARLQDVGLGSTNAAATTVFGRHRVVWMAGGLIVMVLVSAEVVFARVIRRQGGL